MQIIEIKNLQDFKNFLDKVVQMKLKKSIVRTSGFISVDFSEIQTEIDFIYDLKDKFDNVGNLLLPDQFFVRLNIEINELNRSLNQVNSFNPASSNITAEKNGIVNDFRKYFYNFIYKMVFRLKIGGKNFMLIGILKKKKKFLNIIILKKMNTYLFMKI